MPRRAREQPTAMDALDPAPAPPRARKPRRPPKGEMEKQAEAMIGRLPDDPDLRLIAIGALDLARDIDAKLVAGRDKAGHFGQIRQAVAMLRELAPGEARVTKNDELKARREKRATGG